MRDLLQRARDGLDPRLACHELAAIARRHFEAASGHPVSNLTAGEIRQLAGQGPIVVFFERLNRLQFGRRAPRRKDLSTVCELAIQAADQPLGRPR